MAGYAFIDYTNALLITRVRAMLNEPNPLQFTDAEIVYWIDRGANIVLKDSKGKRNVITFNATSGIDLYDYTTLFGAGKVITVETVFYAGVTKATLPAPQPVSGGYCLEKIHPRQIAKSPHAVLTGPRFWYEQHTGTDRYIGISPIPVNTAGGGSDAYLLGYVVLYYENEVTFADSTNAVNLLPNHLQEVVTWYVLEQANIKLKRYAVANMFKSIFTNYLMFYRQDYLPKPVDSADMMVAPDYTQFQ